MAWDPAIYLRFEAERTRPAADLLARVPLGGIDYAVDLGCGTGNSTSLLYKRWPRARIEGVDNSAEMLAKAELNSFQAAWIESDIADWAPGGSPDVIFTNAALQWLPDHATLLPRLMSFLRKGGVFAMQVPSNFQEPCHTLLHELENDPRWKARFLRPVERWAVPGAAEYFAILEPHAARIDLWETRYMQVLDGDDAAFHWMSGTGLRPYLRALEGEARDSFEAEYRARMAKAYPRRTSGRTLYPFKRLFAVAVR